MIDPRVTKLAQILINHSTRIEPSDRVIIEATTAAEPLIRAVFKQILQAGGHPHLLLEIPEQEKELFSHGNADQLAFVNEFQKLAYEQFEARIRIHSLTNTHALRDVKVDLQSQRQKAKAPILETQMDRGASGAFKWVTTLYPTQAYADEAGMTQSAFEDFVYQACHADKENPIPLWTDIKEKQDQARALIQGHNKVELQGPNIDLTLVCIICLMGKSLQGRWKIL